MLGVLTKHLKHQCVDVLDLARKLMPCLHSSRFSVACFIPCRNEVIALFLCPIRCTLQLILSQLEEPLSSVNEFTMNLASAFSKQTFTMSDMTDWHLYVFVIHWRWKPSFLYQIPLDCSLSHPHSSSLTLHADFKNRTLSQKPRDSKILPVNWSTSHLLFHALYLIILDSHWMMAWHNYVMADGIITDRLKDCTLDVSFWWV